MEGVVDLMYGCCVPMSWRKRLCTTVVCSNCFALLPGHVLPLHEYVCCLSCEQKTDWLSLRWLDGTLELCMLDRGVIAFLHCSAYSAVPLYDYCHGMGWPCWGLWTFLLTGLHGSVCLRECMRAVNCLLLLVLLYGTDKQSEAAQAAGEMQEYCSWRCGDIV